MTPHHILAAYDCSEPAEAAFDHALHLAERVQARLSVISVTRPPEMANDAPVGAFASDAVRDYEGAHDRLRLGAAARNVSIETRVLVGDPADEILRFAATARVELIVIGQRGRSPIRTWASGTTTHRVVDYASCPVLVVRAG